MGTYQDTRLLKLVVRSKCARLSREARPRFFRVFLAKLASMCTAIHRQFTDNVFFLQKAKTEAHFFYVFMRLGSPVTLV